MAIKWNSIISALQIVWIVTNEHRTHCAHELQHQDEHCGLVTMYLLKFDWFQFNSIISSSVRIAWNYFTHTHTRNRLIRHKLPPLYRIHALYDGSHNSKQYNNKWWWITMAMAIEKYLPGVCRQLNRVEIYAWIGHLYGK